MIAPMFFSLEFSNSSSFLEPQDFNLARPPRATRQLSAAIEDSSWDPEVSSVAAIFGANASGKSGLIRSLSLALKNPTLPGDVRINPFKLQRTNEGERVSYALRFKAPSVVMGKPDSEYDYRFDVAPTGHVVYEELRFFPKERGKSQRLFRRDITTDWKSLFPEDDASSWYRWGEHLKGEKAFAARSTDAKNLFLGMSVLLTNNPLQPVLDWLEESVHFYSATDYESELGIVKRKLHEDKSFREKVIDYVRHADLGITDLKVISRDKEDLDSFRRTLEQREFPKSLIERSVRDFALELIFVHRSRDGDFEFNEAFESEGTKAMIAFASIAIDALRNGSVIVIDEIDTSLHPLLVRELIRQFTSPSTNPKQAQLIFTTHDVTLLHSPSWLKPLLDRDQIWLVEKNEFGESHLYSVDEFPIRTDENIFRKYLAGQYGSVPHPDISSAPIRGAE